MYMPLFYHFFFQTQHTLTLVSGSTEDGIFRCTVQRDIDLSTNQIFGLRNEWYFMFALGNVSKGNIFDFIQLSLSLQHGVQAHIDHFVLLAVGRFSRSAYYTFPCHLFFL